METIRIPHSGTCSRESIVTIDKDIIVDIKIIGGCAGNTQGLCALLRGMKVQDAINRLSGIMCRNGTSCPDQVARGLEKYLNSSNK